MKILQIMSRSYVAPERINETVQFYEGLLATKCAMRFSIDALEIETALVGGIQIVAGMPGALAPFLDVGSAYLVDSVREFERDFAGRGLEIRIPASQGPHGMYMVVQHPDGLWVEYADAQPEETGSSEGEANSGH